VTLIANDAKVTAHDVPIVDWRTNFRVLSKTDERATVVLVAAPAHRRAWTSRAVGLP
jgi:phage-related baseplate assembly protein